MVEFATLERGPDAFQQQLTPPEIEAVCTRAFGPRPRLEAIREMGGGSFNVIYHLRFSDASPAILRVAPPPGSYVPWHEVGLMRAEQALHPYFAPIAPLLPRTLMADFTHQVIGRDYLFQSVMPGEQWSRLTREFSPAEEAELWRQFARVARAIHEVEGTTFGLPHPGPRFDTWSATILDRLERVMQDLEYVHADTTTVGLVRDITREQPHLLDEIARPRLLHGDLWPFNVLVERGEAGPSITAILDCDRGSWGDPLADWTFFLIARRASPEARAVFWEEYGPPPHGRSARFRVLVYDTIHKGNILAEAARFGQAATVTQVHERLGGLVDALRALLAET